MDLEPKIKEENDRNKVMQLKEEGNMILNRNGHDGMEVLVQKDLHIFKMGESSQA